MSLASRRVGARLGDSDFKLENFRVFFRMGKFQEWY